MVANKTAEKARQNHQIIAWVALLGLLFLRIPFLVGVGFLAGDSAWVDIVFDIGTYFLTAFLIWWERDRLADFHIDTLALIIIIVFKPLMTLIFKYWQLDTAMTFPNPCSLVIWAIAIVLTVGLWRSRPHLPSLQAKDLGWFGIGIFSGLIIAFLIAFPMSIQSDALDNRGYPFTLGQMINRFPLQFLYQIGFAAVTEEPLFRGFLWGYLRQLKWKEVWICLFQAFLFTLAHAYYIKSSPVSFWLLDPFYGIVFGLLVWRSRSIATSMAAHGAANATMKDFVATVAYYRFFLFK